METKTKKILSDAHKEKLRLANLGENNPMYGKHGKDNPNYGVPFTDERKKKISNSAKLVQGGAGNAKATEYHLTDPNGMVHIVKGGLEQFCEEYNISEKVLRKYTDKGIIPVNGRANATEKSKNTYGWTFSKIGRVHSK